MDVGHLWLAGQGFQVSNGSVSKMQTIVTYTSSLVFKEVGTSLGELAALDLFEGQCASFEVGSQGAGRALSRVAKGVNLPGLWLWTFPASQPLPTHIVCGFAFWL